MLYDISPLEIQTIRQALQEYVASREANLASLDSVGFPTEDTKFLIACAKSAISSTKEPHDLISMSEGYVEQCKRYRELGDGKSAECALSCAMAFSGLHQSCLAKDKVNYANLSRNA